MPRSDMEQVPLPACLIQLRKATQLYKRILASRPSKHDPKFDGVIDKARRAVEQLASVCGEHATLMTRHRSLESSIQLLQREAMTLTKPR